MSSGYEKDGASSQVARERDVEATGLWLVAYRTKKVLLSALPDSSAVDHALSSFEMVENSFEAIFGVFQKVNDSDLPRCFRSVSFLQILAVAVTEHGGHP